MKTWAAALAATLTIFWASSAGAETLGEMLRDSGWDRIIGTWVDKDTKGERLKTTFAWKFENRVIEVNNKMGELHSVALIAVNAKNGEVFHVGANDKGGGVLGKWTEEDGDAILELGYVRENGEEGEMRIRHHLEDDDTMVVTLERDEPMTVTLVRAKK